MKRIPKSCLKHGHGPSLVLRRRIWWKPWSWRTSYACWLCHTPLSAAEAEKADARWWSFEIGKWQS